MNIYWLVYWIGLFIFGVVATREIMIPFTANGKIMEGQEMVYCSAIGFLYGLVWPAVIVLMVLFYSFYLVSWLIRRTIK